MTDVQWATLRPILQDLTDRIARIEQFLASSGFEGPASTQPGEFTDAVPGSFGVPMGGNQNPQSMGMPDYIVQMARMGKKIEAIKELRLATGMGLREAKNAVDQAARGY